MLGLDALDVAIGLVFVYLMVSFVCSAGVELVEMLMKQRGKHLYQGIVSLLKSDGAKELYKHPLVQSLSTGTSLPSYIPPRNFALAVLNGIRRGSAATNAEVKSARLPVGWDDTPSNGSCWQHIIGWLRTAIAVSFGAPFWFDVLNKFMVVRSTVRPKEKSGPEKSKDAH